MKVFTSFMMLLTKIILFSSGFNITNGPQDTTVCMNTMAECDCGFTGTDPKFIVPSWRIVFRSDDGSIISNDTIDGIDILKRLINDLQWIPDLTSGDNNGTNSKLLVGPVNMTHNQSSYQCIFPRSMGDTVISSIVGTMTVVDQPSVIINVTEICATSIIISLNASSHSACGDVSHNVTISDNVIDTVGGSAYTIDELQSDTLYNITVTSTYRNSGSRIVYQSVRTSLAKPPYPIDVTSIEGEKTNDDNVRIMWEPPEIDWCSMLAIKHYDVTIYPDDGEIIISKETDVNSVTFPMKHFKTYSNTAFMVNVTVTVVDIEGQKSTTSTHTVIINGTQNINPNNKDEVEEPNIEGSDDDSNTIVIPITIILVLTGLVIIIIVIILLYLRHRHLHKSHDVKSEKRTEDNCYVTQDESKSQDTTLYAVSGPTSAWSDSTQSKSNEVETNHEPSIHNDDIDEDESTPPLPPRLNYAEIQLTSEVPKIMKADHDVAYAETKPA